MATDVRPEAGGTEQRATALRTEPLEFKRAVLPKLGRYKAPDGQENLLCSGALLYTTCDEDSWSELRALEIGSGDSVLSVTGSGCRSLNLLLAGPRRLVSLDANPLQNHLLELKAAAIRRLDHSAFLAFLGVRPDAQRLAEYSRLAGELSPSAREFWDLNSQVIERGLIYSGAHETYYRRMMGLLMAPRRRMLRDLFELRDLDAQRRFYEQRWNSQWWKRGIRDGTSSFFYRLLLPDPSYIAHVEVPVGPYLYERFEHTLTTRLARENHWLAMLLLGRYHNEQAMPPYLCGEHFETVKANLDALEIHEDSVDGYLERHPGERFDAFSLSDISGWMPRSAFEQVLDRVVGASAPGARLCYRNFLAKPPFPDRLRSRVTSRPDVAAAIEHDDQAFAFSFEVGEVAASR